MVVPPHKRDVWGKGKKEVEREGGRERGKGKVEGEEERKRGRQGRFQKEERVAEKKRTVTVFETRVLCGKVKKDVKEKDVEKMMQERREKTEQNRSVQILTEQNRVDQTE